MTEDIWEGMMSKSKNKWAILCVHGMGDPLPMNSANEILEAVYSTNETIISRSRKNPVTQDKRGSRNSHWVKPDLICGSDELRRITTETLEGKDKDYDGKRLDFFEHYWSHATHDNQWHHVTGWLVYLFLRRPGRVPSDLKWIFWAFWGFAIFGFALIAAAFGTYHLAVMPELPAWLPSFVSFDWVPDFVKSAWFPGLVLATWPIVMFLVNIIAENLLVHKFGDVARYLQPQPKNIEAREKIRSSGVELLHGLIESERYERIIVVAHSLGSIVAHDILSTAFDKYNQDFNDKAQVKNQNARNFLEEYINEGFRNPVAWEPSEYQQRQSDALAEAHQNGSKWNVTDFVSLGCPLTHAEILLAKNDSELTLKQQQRLLATCPPQMEYDQSLANQQKPCWRFTYDPKHKSKRDPLAPRVPHHAAVFAYTRWTNIWSKRDVISGPLHDTMGHSVKGGTRISGIKDIAVLPELESDGKAKLGQRGRWFTHTHYWRADKHAEQSLMGRVPSHIKTLRKAIGLV